jgi:hypothetical protein
VIETENFSKYGYSNIVWIDTTQEKMVYSEHGIFNYLDYSSYSDISYEYRNGKLNKITFSYKKTVRENESINGIFLILFLIGCIIILITMVIELVDSDINFFDLPRVRKDTLKKLVIMDEEDGVKYYHLMGRLLVYDKNNYINIRNLTVYIENYMENPKILPKWEGTKRDKRDNLLTKLLK